MGKCPSTYSIHFRAPTNPIHRLQNAHETDKGKPCNWVSGTMSAGRGQVYFAFSPRYIIQWPSMSSSITNMAFQRAT